MLLTIDLGNTSIKLGIFDNNEQLSFACFDGEYDNYRSLMLSFIFKSGFREDQINAAVYSCVVPKLYDKVYDAITSIVGIDNIIDINPKKNYGIKLNVPNPEEVGDDIIVMSSYAYNQYHRELLIVSMGTCTVISHVTKYGEFSHCIIAPGFSKVSETLWNNAAQLPKIELNYSDSYLANTTVGAMNVGIFNGYIGMITSLIRGIRNEINEEVLVIGCGGLGKEVAPHIYDLDLYDPDFVTKGLNFIYENSKYEKNNFSF